MGSPIRKQNTYGLTHDTEILSVNGWKKYNEIKKGDLIITFDKQKDILIENKIQEVIIRNFDGELINYNSKQLNIMVTPDHKCIIKRFQHNPKRYKYYDYTIVNANKCPKQFMIPSVSILNKPDFNPEELTNDILKIMGWIITDGWFHHKNKRKNLALEQSHKTKKINKFIFKEMTSLLNKYYVKYGDRVRAGKIIAKNKKPSPVSSSRYWVFPLPLSLLLLKYLQNDIHRIPREILKNCSHKQLAVLYQGLMEGDGTSNVHKTKWKYLYAGLNEGLSDDVQELCQRIGIRAIKRISKQNNQWGVSISNQKQYWIRNYPIKVAYVGIIWNIKIPLGAFIVRRNGRAWITGSY